LVLANSLRGFAIHEVDGILGHIDDFYFDDRTWEVTRVIAGLGHWLPGREVLLPPDLLGHVDWRKKFIEARTTRDAVRKSPEWDSAPPVSYQFEKRANVMFVANAFSLEMPVIGGMNQEIDPVMTGERRERDPHLQSVLSLKEIDIVSETGTREGSLVDFLIDTETWEIRFLLLKSKDGRVFLAQPDIVRSIDFSKRAITISHHDDEKEEWQEYDPHYMAMLEIEQP
jgi:sporulation protein YlmC with PRC-barrel domain